MTNTNQAAAAGDISREAAAELIYREAMLLDQHQWEEWLSLYSADAVFWMPSWGSESELITDPDETLCLLFNVMKMKNMYGKQVRGIERSTFVIDAQGKLVKEWRGVRVPSHVEEVLAYVKTLA